MDKDLIKKRIFASGPSISQLEVDTVMDALKNGWYEDAYYYCELFQKEFAKYHDRKYALMTPNCTTAIHLVLAGLGIGKNDEVIVPECTWIGSAAGVKYLGAKTIFCDIDKDNWCIDPAKLEKIITKNTKAVIAVDLYGNMPNYEQLEFLCNKHKIALIEDAAEAVGSIYKGKKAGNFGVASTFSFHRTKTITTGEGGMLILDDKDLFERCSFLRDHGRIPGGRTYWNHEVTFKYMPSNIQAALGLAQLKRVNELINIKRTQLKLYKEELSSINDLRFNTEPPQGINGAWITTLVFGNDLNITKENALEFLNTREIPARPFFYPLSSLPAYGGQGDHMQEVNPISYNVSNRGINLPGAMNISKKEIKYICNQLKKLLACG